MLAAPVVAVSRRMVRRRSRTGIYSNNTCWQQLHNTKMLHHGTNTHGIIIIIFFFVVHIQGSIRAALPRQRAAQRDCPSPGDCSYRMGVSLL